MNNEPDEKAKHHPDCGCQSCKHDLIDRREVTAEIEKVLSYLQAMDKDLLRLRMSTDVSLKPKELEITQKVFLEIVNASTLICLYIRSLQARNKELEAGGGLITKKVLIEDNAKLKAENTRLLADCCVMFEALENEGQHHCDGCESGSECRGQCRKALSLVARYSTI